MFYIYIILCVIFCGSYVEGILWKHGIIHYSINSKDYDVHSQEIILSTLSQLQEIMCVKFFQTAPEHAAKDYDKILYINNPDKRKECPKNVYDFRQSIVDMPIGYRCLNQKDVARIVVDMLRASIESNGHIRKWPPRRIEKKSKDKLIRGRHIEDTEADLVKSPLISSWERNYINSNYKSECGLITPPLLPTLRRQSATDDIFLSDANLQYYNDRLWELGIVFYGFDKSLLDNLTTLNQTMIYIKQAMNIIERLTCIVFQEIDLNDAVKPNRVITLYTDYITDNIPKSGINMANLSGDRPPWPKFGRKDINKQIHFSVTVGTVTVNDNPERWLHEADAGQSKLTRSLNMLFWYLGVPFMSNRFDRDNYVTINWKIVRADNMEYAFVKEPESAWIVGMPYDFNSVTHPPTNIMCKGNCYLGDYVIRPIQDYLWQREIYMGHAEVPSENDIKIIDLLYRNECRKRFRK